MIHLDYPTRTALLTTRSKKNISRRNGMWLGKKWQWPCIEEKSLCGPDYVLRPSHSRYGNQIAEQVIHLCFLVRMFPLMDEDCRALLANYYFFLALKKKAGPTSLGRSCFDLQRTSDVRPQAVARPANGTDSRPKDGSWIVGMETTPGSDLSQYRNKMFEPIQCEHVPRTICLLSSVTKKVCQANSQKTAQTKSAEATRNVGG